MSHRFEQLFRKLFNQRRVIDRVTESVLRILKIECDQLVEFWASTKFWNDEVGIFRPPDTIDVQEVLPRLVFWTILFHYPSWQTRSEKPPSALSPGRVHSVCPRSDTWTLTVVLLQYICSSHISMKIGKIEFLTFDSRLILHCNKARLEIRESAFLRPLINL